MEIQILRRQGKGIREIVKLTGHSRNTVRKYLRDGQVEPQPALRVKRASKLDPFKAYIAGRIKAAKPDRLPANVLLREIVAMGYTGRERILRAFIAKLCQKPPRSRSSALKRLPAGRLRSTGAFSDAASDPFRPSS